MGDYSLNTIKGHGLAVGDTVNFYGMGNSEFPPAEEASACVLTKVGRKYVLTYGEGVDALTWEFGPSAKVWASKVEAETPEVEATGAVLSEVALVISKGAAPVGVREAEVRGFYWPALVAAEAAGYLVEHNSRFIPTAEGISAVSARTAEASVPSERERKADLYNRALFLGYTQESAARMSDCFANWDMVSDPCSLHPNHSTVQDHLGYAVDQCEACDVITLSDGRGYTLAGWQAMQAERAAENARLEVEHVTYMRSELAKASDGECVCDLIMALGAAELPQGGRACGGCGSIFTPEGTEASPETVAASLAVIRRNQAPAARVITKGSVLATPIDSLMDSGAKPAKAEVSSWGLPYGEASGLPILPNVRDNSPGILARHRATEPVCRSTSHVYCVGPCAIRTRNEANASAARTHVETEAECLARIEREDFRVGDRYTFCNLAGYRPVQERPFSCRGVKCQCGKACHGTVVQSEEILTDVAHYVSGGLEIRGNKGSRAVIRPDRLD